MIPIMLALGVGCFGYLLGLIVYRLYFHPLAKFPGPKLPACTLWCDFYYDVVLRGQLIWKIQEWHGQYGPIIRINPHELHILDSDYYDDIYGSQSRKRDKYQWWVNLSGTPGSSFSTVTHNHHRLRRGALNPFFSKKAVTALESLIHDKVSILLQRFEGACKTGEIIRADVAYIALTMDVICQYIFAADDNYLLEDDFKLAWKQCLAEGTESGALMRHFPWMAGLMKALPDSCVAMASPPLHMLLTWRRGVEQRAKTVLNANDAESKWSHRTIFHELRDGDLPPQEKTLDRLVDEIQILTGAGSETTAQTLAYITFYLLSNPEKLHRLRNELKSALPNPTDRVSHTVIEQLPYVSAVVSEGLRLSFGVTTRLPRIAPDEDLLYKHWTIPRGTPVSSTSYFVLMDPAVFPEPGKFEPERWLDDTAPNGRPLHRYLVNFGKGTRQCVGINLAYAELYIAIASIFRHFRMELYETTVEDVECRYDFFTAVPKLDSKGIRIRVVEQLND